jgi:hypothetical protein
MRRTTLTVIVLAALAGLAVAAVSSASGGIKGAAAGGKLKVRISDMNAGGKGDSVTNGGLAGTGRFTASGAISDNGKALVYRTVKEPLITLRYVTAGKKGTITFVVKINMTLGSSRWTITSGTKVYKGLHGKGIERENLDYTVSTLTGTVWR